MSQSLDRGLQILSEIAAGRRTLSEIAASLGVHKTTVLRLLGTLQDHHLVFREDAHNYQLGRGLFNLASFALAGRDVVPVSRASVQALSRETNHTVYVATLEAEGAVVVEAAIGDGRLNAARRVGEAVPLHASAAGKVLLAGLREEQLESLLYDYALSAYTDHTITNVKRLRDQLEQVRDAGFALEEAEYEEFVSAIASPIRDSNGDVVASLALTLPAIGVVGEALTKHAARVLSAADRISGQLGWD